ncbi:MAG: MFS transporter [candidate division KSB1 bacterium]|nr:MFS transporter [candidate division KSB1 bacterium]MDZ7304057.1 MFS transporter [candidate division KSB1 bacterium]MDZ7313232.1 MFS transporter [candidate division KSB1 bacterium]
MNQTKPKGALSWAMYDWANSAFSTTVQAGFFPIFFKNFWSTGAEVTESTLRLGIAVSTASLIVALIAPILGAFADRGAMKKRSLSVFATLGIAATGGLYWVAEGNWQLAALLYVLGCIGFLGSLVFYDSLIISVSNEQTVDFISGRGYALGYLGGGLLFLLNVLMVQKPALFGLSGAAAAVRLSFLTVAVWWGVFSIPLLLNVAEPMGGVKMSFREAARAGFAQLAKTFHEIRKLKIVLTFLAAYWLYIDGVDTIITMAVDYGKSIGIADNELIFALLMVQFVGFPFAYLLGYLGQKWGAKKLILFAITVYLLVTVLGANMSLKPYQIFGWEISQFYTLAFLIAMVQGCIQALSRSFYSRIIPKDKAAEFYGFYNMLGKFAAIIGPVLMGTVGRITGNPRAGIQSIAVLFVAGAILLLRVNENEGRKMAQALSATGT